MIGKPLLLVAALALQPALGQQLRLISADKRALVLNARVSSAQPYRLHTEQYGAVWVAMTSGMSARTTVNNREVLRMINPGDSGTVGSGGSLQFQLDKGRDAQLIVILPKQPHQPLTVGPLDLPTDDASDRNATLVVALTSCLVADTRNVPDESTWIPGKQEVVSLHKADVRWIRPGIHHLRSLGRHSCRLISIEW